MIVLTEINPADGVPDALYEALHWEPFTDEERWAGMVLRFHRDYLNGGLDQALFNLESIGERHDEYVDAYHRLGLVSAAEVVGRAVYEVSIGVVPESRWDALDDAYGRLTYGESRDQPDLIEKMVVIYAQSMGGRFENAVALANE